VHVAPSTFSTSCDYNTIVFFSEIPKQFSGISISHLSAHRHQQKTIFTAPAGLLFAAAMGSPRCLEVTLEVKVKEGLFSACGLDHHITAVATISAIRTAPRHVLFTPETNAASAAVTGPNVDLDFIDKTHCQR